MRRGPTFLRSRRRERVRRLALRAGLVAAGITAVAGAVSLLGGDDGPTGQADRVAFTGRERGEGVPEPPPSATVARAAREIRSLLDGWYQQAFADPSQYGDGSFDDVARMFTGDAALGFVEDRDVLTIGSDARRVREIRVTRSQANVTVYAEDGTVTHATAAVRFDGDLRLRNDPTPHVLVQRVSLVLEHRGEGGWTITNYYGAVQERQPTADEGDA